VTWLPFDTWIVIIGVLCAVACALPGCFLVLRQMSMMGDAISHAVLPGLAVAFMITGSRASITMFAGAVIVGVMTTTFTQWISTFGKVDRGASMGIVFTTLFALGLLLIVQAADHVDLDPGCVLYGAIELTPLDTLVTLQLDGFALDIPRAAAVLGAVLLINLTVVVLLFKELKISAFDPELSTTLGINAAVMHYLLMTMVAVTTVASFEAVGSIIVIAMLIVPAATAYLLTDRLAVMIVISTLVAALSACLGHFAALTIPPLVGFESTTTSGMMAAASGFLFVLAWLFAPRHGLLARNLRPVAERFGQSQVVKVASRRPAARKHEVASPRWE
jgi:manganese/zinc/iron transport system permease protein